MSDLYDLVNHELREECRRLGNARSLCALLRAHLSLYLQPRFRYYPGCRFDNEMRGLLFIFKECASKRDFDRSAMNELVAYLVLLCYGWDIEDSELVTESLQYMYKVKCHFNLLYQPTFLHILLSYGIIVWPVEFINRRHQVTYFAHHSAKTKALFDGAPFVDVGVLVDDRRWFSPLWYNGMMRNVPVMKILLQHGASLAPPTNRPEYVAEFVMKVIDEAAAELKANSPDDEISFDDITRIVSSNSTISTDLQCANVILKAFPPLKLRHFRIGFFRNLFPCFGNELDFLRTMSDERLVPMLKYSFEEPPSLKHLSRIVVRERLQRNRELPFGIYTLDVPQEIKHFLELDDI